MSVLHIDRISRELVGHEPTTVPLNPNTRQAAVAAILRPSASGAAETEALFILRAKKLGDPWSGQMAFPGGHREPFDESLRATAVRETREEIGLCLDTHGEFLGQLNQVRVNPRGRNIDMVVTPLVFRLVSSDVTMTPNYEVADILWGSLAGMHQGQSLVDHEFAVGNQVQSFSGYRVGEEVVWGLTLQMLDHLFTALDPAYQPRGI